jgi:cytochrome c
MMKKILCGAALALISDALRKTGWLWNETTLRNYLSRPVKESNPGGKMKYEGLRDAQALDDLLTYLATVR